MTLSKHKQGFTIVELLIVIVVIGILAAITIVVFNGVTKKATASAVQSELTNNAKIVMAANAVSGQYATADVMNGTVATKFDLSKYKVVSYCASSAEFAFVAQTTAGDKFYVKNGQGPVQNNSVDAYQPCTATGISGGKITYLNLPSPCATENQTCSFSGTATVVFGHAGSGQFTSKSNLTGSIQCSYNASDGFGADPAYGYGKSCYVYPN